MRVRDFGYGSLSFAISRLQDRSHTREPLSILGSQCAEIITREASVAEGHLVQAAFGEMAGLGTGSWPASGDATPEPPGRITRYTWKCRPTATLRPAGPSKIGRPDSLRCFAASDGFLGGAVGAGQQLHEKRAKKGKSARETP